MDIWWKKAFKKLPPYTFQLKTKDCVSWRWRFFLGFKESKKVSVKIFWHTNINFEILFDPMLYPHELRIKPIWHTADVILLYQIGWYHCCIIVRVYARKSKLVKRLFFICNVEMQVSYVNPHRISNAPRYEYLLLLIHSIKPFSLLVWTMPFHDNASFLFSIRNYGPLAWLNGDNVRYRYFVILWTDATLFFENITHVFSFPLSGLDRGCSSTPFQQRSVAS